MHVQRSVNGGALFFFSIKVAVQDEGEWYFKATLSPVFRFVQDGNSSPSEMQLVFL